MKQNRETNTSDPINQLNKTSPITLRHLSPSVHSIPLPPAFLYTSINIFIEFYIIESHCIIFFMTCFFYLCISFLGFNPSNVCSLNLLIFTAM